MESCVDSAENGAPHENTINSNEIEVRALGKAVKKPLTTEEQQYEHDDENQTHFLCSLDSFWELWRSLRLPFRVSQAPFGVLWGL